MTNYIIYVILKEQFMYGFLELNEKKVSIFAGRTLTRSSDKPVQTGIPGHLIRKGSYPALQQFEIGLFRPHRASK